MNKWEELRQYVEERKEQCDIGEMMSVSESIIGALVYQDVLNKMEELEENE